MPRKRWIAHFDADAFFASVEQALDPSLKGKLVAVGGTTRGIISSASYEARARGVRTPMPTVSALKICPELILINSSHGRYGEFSRKIFSFAEDITPYIERTSIDEGYLDLTPCRGDPVELMRGFSERVTRELDVTLSVGLASNKLVSAVASKWKKPRGFTVVEHGKEAEFLAPLPISTLPFIGPKTQKTLNAEGFFKIADIQRISKGAFEKIVGEAWGDIYENACGRDDREVHTERDEAKSVSEQETFERDVGDFSRVAGTLKQMLDRLLTQLRESDTRARTLTLRIRYGDWEQHTVSKTISQPSDLEQDFYPLVEPLLRQAWTRKKPLRLVGARLSNFGEAAVQGDLFAQGDERLRTLAKTADALNRAKNQPAVLRASHLKPPGEK